MLRTDFSFDLPPELIAQTPLNQRSASRLLALTSAGVQDDFVRNLAGFLRPGDLLVFNNTRVIPARLRGRKETGGKVEVFIERQVDEHNAWAFLGASKTPKPGSRLFVDDAQIDVGERDGELFHLSLPQGQWSALLKAQGEIPLPPYIQRNADEDDAERYQTVFAKEEGAVAAPTAGLHFDQALLESVEAAGAKTAYVTLHVGAGTFQPMRVQKVDEHKMHSERVQVPEETVRAIAETRAAGGRIIAVGTTVVRALETAAQQSEVLAPFFGESRLFITPGFKFRVVDALMTNFHLPESTLLMLVCAFAGQEEVLAAYQHAVEQRYRFFSYGDAMWLERKE